ncbi:hypothetical protein [Rhodopirellula sp. MGV]|uniref:hypothetical protein n=1 Tax=Rhodopirellula sp. MGV TaxID=2023130 RepID=UPI000B97B526|nr:hypothetical protein [Rhodopirellula sp. MGV]OYP36862.1 hypothetical protein CGZ80_07385 [Rhodopirellula sp. MGV]PNY34058.1 hypothetical protein C2E31_25355 [Rhodopirellula baltica]
MYVPEKTPPKATLLNRTQTSGMVIASVWKKSLACAIGLGIAATPAFADGPSHVRQLGRLLGVGWGDGYHACSNGECRPGADLPPHGFAARHIDCDSSAASCEPCNGIYPPGFGLPAKKHHANNCDTGACRVPPPMPYSGVTEVVMPPACIRLPKIGPRGYAPVYPPQGPQPVQRRHVSQPHCDGLTTYPTQGQANVAFPVMPPIEHGDWPTGISSGGQEVTPILTSPQSQPLPAPPHAIHADDTVTGSGINGQPDDTAETPNEELLSPSDASQVELLPEVQGTPLPTAPPERSIEALPAPSERQPIDDEAWFEGVLDENEDDLLIPNGHVGVPIQNSPNAVQSNPYFPPYQRPGSTSVATRPATESNGAAPAVPIRVATRPDKQGSWNPVRQPN